MKTVKITRPQWSKLTFLLGVSISIGTIFSSIGNIGAPLLVSKFGFSFELANRLSQAVAALGGIPWWAFALVGGGLAGLLVRNVLQYGVRYGASW